MTNFEKIKKELMEVAMPLHSYLRNNYKDRYIPFDKEGVAISGYGNSYFIELYATLKDRGMRKPSYKYTPKSVKKTVYLNVFLGSLIISRGFYSKTPIQQLSEN